MKIPNKNLPYLPLKMKKMKCDNYELKSYLSPVKPRLKIQTKYHNDFL